jgi:predicted transcriptional regulator
MAAPIQSPAKCEVRSVIRFLNAKGERPVEIHKQIVAVYGKVMNRQNVTKWCREFSEGRTDVHDEQGSGKPSVISDDQKGRRQTSLTRGYRSWFQDLINVRTIPATILKNKVMYRQFIHSVAFVN